MCFEFLYKVWNIFFILRRNVQDMIKTQVDLHVKYTLFFSDLNVTFLGRL